MNEFNYESLEQCDFYNNAEKKWVFHGYRCFIKSNMMGYLCGYIALPQGHPLEGCDYDCLSEINVHGGLTFASDIVSSPLHACWTLGFDCAHSGDLPLSDPFGIIRSVKGEVPGYDVHGHVWNYDEVSEECEQLVLQVEAVLKNAVLVAPLCGLVTTHCANDHDFGNLMVQDIIEGLTLDKDFASSLLEELGGDVFVTVPESVPSKAMNWIDWRPSGESMQRLECTARIWKSQGFGSLGMVLDAGQHVMQGNIVWTCRFWADKLGISAMLDAYADNVPIADIVA